MKLNYKEVVAKLSQAQEADNENRDKVRECNSFCFDEWGQWQPQIKAAFEGRPKFQFDKTNALIDDICAESDGLSIGAKVRPAGGGANRETADLKAGILRYIENLSNATSLYKVINRSTVRVGFSVLRVDNEYATEESFEQDLIIKNIPNAVDRVWFGEHYEADGSDIKHAWVLHVGDPDEMKGTFNLDRQVASVSNDNDQTFTRSGTTIKKVSIGEYLYLKPYKKDLVQMSDGSVYEDDDNFKKIADEFAAQGKVETKRRTVTCHKQYSQFFDGTDFIGKEYEKPFNYIPLYPVYGNFAVIDDQIRYSGIVKGLMDYQRVINYAGSRELEECALAPARKIVATSKQIQDNEGSFQEVNNPAVPVLEYNPDNESPPPHEIGGSQVNPALANISNNAKVGINESVGVTAAMQGANPKYQSGEAIKLQIGQGAAKTSKYIEPLEVSATRMYKDIVDSIPDIYDTKRTILILNDDGTDETVTLNEQVFDEQTQQMVQVNNVSSGKYDVVIQTDKAYKTKRQESAEFVIQMAAVDPSLLVEAADIIYSNVDAAGMDKVGERKRKQMLMQGMIPDSQMTDEEKQEVQIMQQAAAQNQQPDPAMVMAQAEMLKGQADVQEQDNKAFELQIRAEEVGIKGRDQSLKEGQAVAKHQLDSEKTAADIGYTRAKTANEIASMEETATKTEAQMIENAMSLAPTVTVVTTKKTD